MIDYLTVIYKNYELLDLQIENFKKRFTPNQYRLVVVDNTPNNLKQKILPNNIIDTLILLDSVEGTFDGVSHGQAIDAGLMECKSDIISIFDSDFFFLQENLNDYVIAKFEEGYKAVGSEWNDGDGTKSVVNNFPHMFDNIPCCFGSFYDNKLCKSETWTISQDEVYANRPTGFIEVGWRIRKKILNEKIKTMSWKTDSNQYGECVFFDENHDRIGYHHVAASHVRGSNNQIIRKIIF